MSVFITALSAADRAGVLAHLLRLNADDRSLRFAAGLVTDETVRRYAASIDFEQDILMGLVTVQGLMVGLVHGCVFEARGQRHVELAFSVDAEWRGHGYASRLMEAVTLRIASGGRAMLVASCATRNWPMRRVFQRGQMDCAREDDEIVAQRVLPAAHAAAQPDPLNALASG